jgi:hypothetical protein
MSLDIALALYYVLIFIVTMVAFAGGLSVGAAIIVALVLSQVVLNIVKPPRCVDADSVSSASYWTYMAIQIGTIIVIYIYALLVASSSCRIRMST